MICMSSLMICFAAVAIAIRPEAALPVHRHARDAIRQAGRNAPAAPH